MGPLQTFQKCSESRNKYGIPKTCIWETKPSMGALEVLVIAR